MENLLGGAKQTGKVVELMGTLIIWAVSFKIGGAR